MWNIVKCSTTKCKHSLIWINLLCIVTSFYFYVLNNNCNMSSSVIHFVPGLVFDITGSWDLSFYMAGVWIMIAGLFVALLPLTNNRNICGKGPVEKKVYGLPWSSNTIANSSHDSGLLPYQELIRPMSVIMTGHYVGVFFILFWFGRTDEWGIRKKLKE